MIKVHMHTNDPQKLFDILQTFNKDPILKKEKVEDMLAMRESMHGDDTVDSADAKFTVMGMPNNDLNELHAIPVFFVPSTTQEPIDARFISEADTCVILNQQRHKETEIKYTTAAPNPMQLKIELLAALSKGKPLLIVLPSADKRASALGRNTMSAIEMLEDEQKKLVHVFVHGWALYDSTFVMEAISCCRSGQSADEAIATCREFGDHCFSFSNFFTSSSVKTLMAWRPALFPDGFSIEDDSFVSFGVPVTTSDVVLTEAERFEKLMTMQNKAKSMTELQDKEIARIKADLKADELLSKVFIRTVGRIDYGHKYLQKMKEASVPMMDDVEVSVCNSGMISVVTSRWGEMSAVYSVKKVISVPGLT